MIKEAVAARAANVFRLKPKGTCFGSPGSGGGDVIVSRPGFVDETAYASFAASSRKYFGIGVIVVSRISGYWRFRSGSHEMMRRTAPTKRIGSPMISAVMAGALACTMNHCGRLAIVAPATHRSHA